MNNRKRLLDSIRTGYTSMQLQVKEREDLEKLICEHTENYEQLSLAKAYYESIIILCDNGIQSYKTKRLEELCLGSELVLDKLFPGENFDIRMVPYMKNRKSLSKLEIGKDGVYSEMKDQNGRMCRQAVSFKVNTEVQKRCGAMPILVDEALNSGDSDSTQVMGTVIKELVDLGLQVILTEHKHELYNNLPRRQFNLVKDITLDRITEVTVRDYE